MILAFNFTVARVKARVFGVVKLNELYFMQIIVDFLGGEFRREQGFNVLIIAECGSPFSFYLFKLNKLVYKCIKFTLYLKFDQCSMVSM